MWKCPICSNDIKTKYICKSCGFDCRKDFVQLKTLSLVPAKDVKERNDLIKAYKNKMQKNDDAEQKLKAADEAEQKRRLEAEREIQKQLELLKEKKHLEELEKRRVGNKPKKKSLGKKILLTIVILGLLGNVIKLFVDTDYSERESDLGKTAIELAWSAIKDASIVELSNSEIDYTVASDDEIYNYLLSQGYYASTSGEIPPNMQEGTMTSLGVEAQLNDGTFTYDFFMDDWYAAGATDWHEREMYFSDDRYQADYIGNIQYENIHQGITPLPCGIEYGDSFDTVCDKLGITDEMIEQCIEGYRDSMTYATITVPTNLSGGIADGYIFMIFDQYTFSYSFTANNNELYNYTVTIQK